MLRTILLLGAWSAMSAYAIADVTNATAASDEEEDVSESLLEFFDQAVDAGILAEPGTLDGALQSDAIADTRLDCQSTYPLEFSDYVHVRRYADIGPYRDAVDLDDPGATSVPLVKAYLALGLYAEAIANRNKAGGLSAQAYTQVARLMDGYLQPDERFFSTLAGCYSEAGLWQGISALASRDMSGVALLDGNVEAFRDLPFQLRSDVAALVLPTLRHGGHSLIGKKLLATFSPAELRQSSRLSIQASFLEVGEGHATGSQIAYDFLSRIAPGTDELISGVDPTLPLGDAQRVVLVEAARNVLSRPADSADVAAALKFVLEDLGRRSDYSDFTRLLDMQSLSAPDFQQEVKEHLATYLIADLKTGDTLVKMSAVNLLVNNSAVLSGHSAEQDVLSLAMEFLTSQGRTALAAGLLASNEPGVEQAIVSARLAYQRDDSEALYKLAQENMGQADIAYLGALAAVKTRDAEVFGKVEPYLPQQAELLVELAEEDVVAGGWLLSEATYEVAKDLGDEAQSIRIDEVLSLKMLTRLVRTSVTGVEPKGVASRLSASGAALDQIEGEAR